MERDVQDSDRGWGGRSGLPTPSPAGSFLRHELPAETPRANTFAIPGRAWHRFRWGPSAAGET